MASRIDIETLGTKELYSLLHQVIKTLEERTMTQSTTEVKECAICFETKQSGVACKVCKNACCIVCELKLLVSSFKKGNTTYSCPCCREAQPLFKTVVPSQFLNMVQNRVDKALLDDRISVDEANQVYKMIGNGVKVEVYDE